MVVRFSVALLLALAGAALGCLCSVRGKIILQDHQLGRRGLLQAETTAPAPSQTRPLGGAPVGTALPTASAAAVSQATGAGGCFGPDSGVPYIVANASISSRVWPRGQALTKEELASAAGAAVLSAIKAALPPGLIGDTCLVGLFPAGAGENATDIVVAQALGGPDASLSAEFGLSVLSNLTEARAVPGSPLSQQWAVNMSAATAATFASRVPAGTDIGTGNTSALFLSQCLPPYFAEAMPVAVSDGIDPGSLTVGSQLDNAAAVTECSESGGTLTDQWWLLGRLFGVPTTNVFRDLVLPGIMSTEEVLACTVSFQVLASLPMLNFSFSRQGDWANATALPVLMQTFLPEPSVIPSSSFATADVAYQLLAPLPEAQLADLAQPFNVYMSGSTVANGTNDTLIATGTFTPVSQSQCLPSTFTQVLATATSTQAAANPAPATEPGKSDSSGVSPAAYAVPIAVFGALACVLVGWTAARYRHRPAHQEANYQEGSAAGLESDTDNLSQQDSQGVEAELLALSKVAYQSHYVIPYRELQLQKQLGDGYYGIVWRAMWRETQVAVKFFQPPPDQQAGWQPPSVSRQASYSPPSPRSTTSCTSSELVANLRKEATILASLRHPNCVMYLGICVDPPALVLEYAGLGSLQDVLAQAKERRLSLDWQRRLTLAFGAAKGMLYLHSCTPPILHRDLKSGNLLVDHHWTCKVADFNLSRTAQDQANTAVGSGTVGIGNPRWLAPELLSTGVCTQATDVFAFGMVMWELLTLEIAWGPIPHWTIVGLLMRGARPAIPAPEACAGFASYQAYLDLMQECWDQDPCARPSFETICACLREMRSAESKASKAQQAPRPSRKSVELGNAVLNLLGIRQKEQPQEGSPERSERRSLQGSRSARASMSGVPLPPIYEQPDAVSRVSLERPAQSAALYSLYSGAAAGTQMQLANPPTQQAPAGQHNGAAACCPAGSAEMMAVPGMLAASPQQSASSMGTASRISSDKRSRVSFDTPAASFFASSLFSSSTEPNGARKEAPKALPPRPPGSTGCSPAGSGECAAVPAIGGMPATSRSSAGSRVSFDAPAASFFASSFFSSSDAAAARPQPPASLPARPAGAAGCSPTGSADVRTPSATSQGQGTKPASSRVSFDTPAASFFASSFFSSSAEPAGAHKESLRGLPLKPPSSVGCSPVSSADMRTPSVTGVSPSAQQVQTANGTSGAPTPIS